SSHAATRAGSTAGRDAGPAARPLPSDDLSAVSCPARQTCFAVGQAAFGNRDQRAMLAERWNGRRWSVMHLATPPGGPGVLAGISCTSARACTAVGATVTSGGPVTLAERWNGRRWHIQPTPAVGNGTFAAVSCGSRTSCTAVGDLPFGGVG